MFYTVLICAYSTQIKYLRRVAVFLGAKAHISAWFGGAVTHLSPLPSPNYTRYSRVTRRGVKEFTYRSYIMVCAGVGVGAGVSTNDITKG